MEARWTSARLFESTDAMTRLEVGARSMSSGLLLISPLMMPCGCRQAATPLELARHGGHRR